MIVQEQRYTMRTPAERQWRMVRARGRVAGPVRSTTAAAGVGAMRFIEDVLSALAWNG